LKARNSEETLVHRLGWIAPIAVLVALVALEIIILTSIKGALDQVGKDPYRSPFSLGAVSAEAAAVALARWGTSVFILAVASIPPIVLAVRTIRRVPKRGHRRRFWIIAAILMLGFVSLAHEDAISPKGASTLFDGFLSQHLSGNECSISVLSYAPLLVEYGAMVIVTIALSACLTLSSVTPQDRLAIADDLLQRSALMLVMGVIHTAAYYQVVLVAFAAYDPSEMEEFGRLYPLLAGAFFSTALLGIYGVTRAAILPRQTATAVSGGPEMPEPDKQVFSWRDGTVQRLIALAPLLTGLLQLLM